MDILIYCEFQYKMMGGEKLAKSLLNFYLLMTGFHSY